MRRRKQTDTWEEVASSLSSPSPFLVLRINSGFTLNELSIKIGVTKQAIIRNEQCTFVNPLPKVLDYWVANSTLLEVELTEQYYKFQSAMRSKHKRYFGNIRDHHYSSTIHPFKSLLNNKSTTSVSKFLCLPQSTLDYWLRHPLQQQSVPKVFIDVLQEIGYTPGELVYFCQIYNTHRHNLRSRQ